MLISAGNLLEGDFLLEGVGRSRFTKIGFVDVRGATTVAHSADHSRTLIYPTSRIVRIAEGAYDRRTGATSARAI